MLYVQIAKMHGESPPNHRKVSEFAGNWERVTARVLGFSWLRLSIMARTTALTVAIKLGKRAAASLPSPLASRAVATPFSFVRLQSPWRSPHPLHDSVEQHKEPDDKQHENHDVGQ